MSAVAHTRTGVSLEALDPARLRRRLLPELRPWTSEAVVRLLGIQVVAMLLLGVAWFQVSGTGDLAVQIDWMKVGLGALLLSGITNGLFIMRGRQLVGLACRATLDGLSPKAARARISAADAGGVSGDSVRYSVPNATRFHLADCPLIVGKPVQAEALGTHREAGRTPCELCQP